jgi:hypothetical protein
MPSARGCSGYRGIHSEASAVHGVSRAVAVAGLLAAVTVAIVAPSAASPHHSSRTGMITGIYEAVGPYPLTGVVELTDARGVHIYFHTGKKGSVEGRVAAGTCRATGLTPQFTRTDLPPCSGDGPVVVRAGHRTHFVVTCQFM